MVKRKAEIDLDKWLRLAPAIARMENTSATTAESEVVSNPTPVTETSPVKVEAGVAASLLVGATNNQEDDNEWFWVLLAQFGHERW